ncbi:chemotaxis protein CheA [Lichenibacterium minor]|uniref:Chemotaxis protein CheA n=1 Tax=Lichenibacterium minor TaxID=2316528 RepID=A0A4Q2U5Y0_9HYPH|nr:chemotaxis protein CheA [Lichenibacterium minor]RYC31238.1 chemotaxis protein CheA [Lichenibacterium minor]
MDALAEIKQTFFAECEEQLVELETGLLAIEAGDHDSETINAVFRAVHSVKGGAGAFNLTDLVHFAHTFENAMDLVRVGRLAPAPALIRVMLRAADILADLVRAARADAPHDAASAAVVAADLTVACAGAAPKGSTAAAQAAAAPAEDAFAFVPLAVDLSEFGDLGDAVDLAPAPAANRFRIVFQPRPELYAKGNDTTILMRELALLGALDVSCDASGLPGLADIDPEGAYLTWTATLDTERDEAAVRDIFDFVEWDSSLTIEAVADAAPPAEPEFEFQAIPVLELPDLDLPEPEPAPEVQQPAAANVVALPTPSREAAPSAEAAAQPGVQASPTIRVDLVRVDRLIDLVGELVINQAMLAERVNEAGLARMSQVAVGLDELEQLTREIQDSVMAIRAQPVKSVFQRMPRLAREVAAQVGKTVRLVTEGENTEVDKTVIERLSDPLTHMIRNAIDHGLEKPEARRAAGKPEEGQVRLSALHRSGRIVIEISDDGVGINRERVRAIAVEKGLIPADSKLTDDETDNLIFLPGFSTAAVVSDISGRGVGMDVVKRSIQALGGRISIASVPGKGSTFTMSLPLTLAVLDGMVVTVAGHTLVIPLTAIVEILLPKATEVHGFGGASRVIRVRNGFIPLVDVGEVMGFRGPLDDARAGVALLVEVEGGARSALLVDAIQGQRQVVIKSLESNYGHVPGIAAATILGDGRVALILDVDAAAASGPRGTADLTLALAG